MDATKTVGTAVTTKPAKNVYITNVTESEKSSGNLVTAETVNTTKSNETTKISETTKTTKVPSTTEITASTETNSNNRKLF